MVDRKIALPPLLYLDPRLGRMSGIIRVYLVSRGVYEK